MSTLAPEATAGSTSLVPIVLNGGWRSPDQERCPRVAYDLLNVETGERVFGSCRAYVCDPCRRRRLAEWPYVLAQGRPERLVTLTLAPPDRERRRGQVKELAYRIRQRGYALEWAWNTERNPRGTGLHVHLLQTGDYIPQRELQDLWGGRRVDIRRIAYGENHAAYLLKDAVDRSGYIVKESVLLDGRPVHLSRGFLGRNTVRQVRAAVRRERFGPPGKWVPISPEGVVLSSSCSASLLYQIPLDVNAVHAR